MISLRSFALRGTWSRGAVTLALASLLTGCKQQPSQVESPSIVREHETASPVAAGPPPRVVVVGGGLAGLTAAYTLQKQGISTAVLEAADVWGGRVATAYYGDGLFGEYGVQELWKGNPVLQIAKERGLTLNEEVVEAFSSVVIDGQLHPYIQDGNDAYFASMFSAPERQALQRWMASSKKLYDAIQKKGLADPAVAKLQDISFGAWVEQAKLPKKVSEFLRLTIECELAADWSSFSGVIGLEEFGVFFGSGVPAYHVRGGNIGVVKGMLAALPGPKLLSSTVTAVRSSTDSQGRVRATVTYVHDQEVHEIEAERVVVAVPFVRLHQIQFDPPLSEDKWQAVMTLNRGQYTVVHLLMDKQADALWKVEGKSPFPVLTDGPLGVIYGVVYDSPATQPLQVFSLLVHGAAANGYHMVPRSMKVKELLAGLDKLWPGLSAHVHGSHVYSYHPASIPVWPPGRSPIDERGRALRKPEHGVYLVGDYTVRGHSDGAAESGIAAAEQIAKELGAAR